MSGVAQIATPYVNDLKLDTEPEGGKFSNTIADGTELAVHVASANLIPEPTAEL